MITELTVDDLPKLIEGAHSFYAEGKLPGPFSPDRFIKGWAGLLESRIGLLLGFEKDGEIAGAIGGTIFPDMTTPKVHATELFWYVKPEHRGAGIKLLLEFEKAARDRGADRIWMIHLVELNDGPLDKLYERLGYRFVEKVFVKDL